MSGDYDDGYDIGVRAVGRILRTLIAELRDESMVCETAAGPAMWPEEVAQTLDRAEQRLKEVQGE